MLRQVSKVAIPFDTGVDFEKISFSKVGPSKNRSWGPFGSSFWRLLGTLLEPLGTLLAPCGALWEPLGSIFGSVGRLVAHLAAFWATFDASVVPVSVFPSHFCDSGCFFECFFCSGPKFGNMFGDFLFICLKPGNLLI